MTRYLVAELASVRYKDEDGGGRVVEVLSRTGFVVDREREMMGIGDGEEEIECCFTRCVYVKARGFGTKRV